jgi:thiol-disulfide isomerase/thioredoxin
MTGGLIFVASLGLVNLLVLALLARRVRQLGSRQAVPARPPWLAPGTAVLGFETTTVDGEAVSLERLRGQHSLVGIFSTTCEPCQEQVPVFAGNAGFYGGPAQVLAVVVGTGERADEFIGLLNGKAMVAREGPRGTVSTAFSANALPAVYLLDPAGKVVASGASLAAISHARPAPPAARR